MTNGSFDLEHARQPYRLHMDASSSPRTATLVLVHGAWHGAWCWERVIAIARTRGLSAVTVELPSDSVAAALDAYADVIAATCRAVCGEVVLVGHSLSALALPLVPE